MKREHSDLFNIIKLLKSVIFGFIILIIVIIDGFIYYINQLDESSYSTIEANGVYNLVDSSGNVIATDLTSDDIQKLMEILNNGKD